MAVILMSVFQSIILGIIQGLGEFLPISSTAHLILAPYFFNWPDPGLSFDVALHVGTLLAVISFFWRDWLTILKSALDSFLRVDFSLATNGNVLRVEKNGILLSEYPSKLLWLLLIASVPGAIFGLMLESYADQAFRHPLIIAFSLSFAGLILYLIDKFANHKKALKQISYLDAIVIGLSQAVAIIPGVSRSGATMTAALAMGISREGAARFSFLLSTPIIFGAAAVKLPQLFANGVDAVALAGIAASAISGYMAIKFMLKLIQKIGYAPFFWYRLALAGITILVYIAR